MLYTNWVTLHYAEVRTTWLDNSAGGMHAGKFLRYIEM